MTTGPDFAVTGMTWSAFRPIEYSYLIPSNMFAVVVFGLCQIFKLNLVDSESIIADVNVIQLKIQEGIENYAYTTNSKEWKNLCLWGRWFWEMLASWTT